MYPFQVKKEIMVEKDLGVRRVTKDTVVKKDRQVLMLPVQLVLMVFQYLVVGGKEKHLIRSNNKNIINF